MKNNYKVLIMGGGTGGISIAARLRKNIDDGEMAIVEPSDKHYYQPLWTLVGGGQATKEETEKNEADLIPEGVDWIKQAVQSVNPKEKTVTLKNGEAIQFEFLVVATGLKLNWDQIEGLGLNLGKNGLCSIYEYGQVDAAYKMINEFKGGKAIFVMPPVPIKCAGAPQKIMYLAENIFRINGVRKDCKINYATAGKAMFGIPSFSDALEKVAREKDIEPKFMHKLIGVNADKKEAFFDVTDAAGKVNRETLKYDLLHVVPSMSAHAYVAESGLAFTDGDQKGWLAVNKHSLQHIKYPYIFGIGDVTGVPNSKTGAAIRKQAPVVVENLLAVIYGRELQGYYDGYASCPLVTEIGKVMLAEFGYDGKLMPSFPFDQTIPRRSMWLFKKYFLPKMYWYGMMKGLV